MEFGGIQPTSLIDYPGQLCCTVFTRGCNLRCPYCHNASLVVGGRSNPGLPGSAVLAHLRRRGGLLDGLCLTGGEPLLHPGLLEFVAQVRALGFKVKLDTNGTRPEPLAALLSAGLLDYVALDYKAPLSKYREAVGGPFPQGAFLSTLRLLRNGGIAYEVRTTVVPGLLKGEDLVAIARELTPGERYVLQQFRPTPGLLQPAYRRLTPYPDRALLQMKGLVQPYVGEVIVRGLTTTPDSPAPDSTPGGRFPGRA